MGNYRDLEDEFARADARERELQRQMSMEDGVSAPNNQSGSNAGNYGYGSVQQNNSYGYQQGGYNNFAQQGGYNNFAGQGGYGNRYMQNPNYPPFYNSDHPQQGVYNRGNMYAARSAPPSQQASLKALTIISVVFILVAVLMFALMIIITTSMKNKYARCTAEVDGIVIENILETHTDNDGTSRSYYPVFKYEYEGRTYTERSNSGRYPAKYQVGDNVTVHVNPDKPSEFYVDKDDFIITLIFSIIGGVFLILGIVFIIIRTKTKHRQQMALQ